MPINDNDLTVRGSIPSSSDTHGHAALLLVESLIHGLCEKATLTVGEAALGEIPVIFITATPEACKPCAPPGVILNKSVDPALVIDSFKRFAPA